MTQSPDSSPTPLEEALCATLAEHAPGDVPIEPAWHSVAPRLSSAASQTSALTHQPQRRWRRPAFAIPAVALIALLLMGAGFAGGRYLFAPWSSYDAELQLIGNQHLYTDIQRQASADGITITVVRAYADEGRTILAYTITLAPGASGHDARPFVFNFDLTDQYGESGGGNSMCTPPQGADRQVSCLMDMPGFHPPASATTLDLTWSVYSVLVTHGSAPQETRTAGWSIQFSLPFHHTSNGLGGPYAQPTRASGS